MAVDLKSATPDTTIPSDGFLFGADSQSASAPSVYPMSALISLLFGSTSFSGSAANTLVLSSGATAQNLHVYNTYTDASNYERLSITNDGSRASIIPAHAGTGTARSLALGAGGSSRWEINTSGHLTAVTDAAYDIGPGNANRPRNIYASGLIRAPSVYADNSFLFAGKGGVQASADGFLFLSDNAGTGFDRLAFGGISSASPALKQSSATLQARLADDSDFTFIQGKHQSHAAYVATPQTNTGYITMYDSTGTAYKVMVAA